MVLLGWTGGRSASVPSMAFTDLSYKKFTLLIVFYKNTVIANVEM